MHQRPHGNLNVKHTKNKQLILESEDRTLIQLSWMYICIPIDNIDNLFFFIKKLYPSISFGFIELVCSNQYTFTVLNPCILLETETYWKEMSGNQVSLWRKSLKTCPFIHHQKRTLRMTDNKGTSLILTFSLYCSISLYVL